MDIPSPDSAPAALADLIAAGLVSHEMIGDPGRLGGEAEALRSLCALVAGPVWRLEPFHYAFRIAQGDLGGACDDAGADGRATALEAALQGALGGDAVWVNAADLVPAAAGPGAGSVSGSAAGPLPDAPLLLLRARAEATREALAVVEGEVQAVIGARFAVAAARLAAEGAATAVTEARAEARAEAHAEALVDAGGLAARLAALEAARAGQEAALDRLAGAVATLAAGIDAAAARSEATAAALADGLAAFRDTVGLTLAEFLAELERRAEGRVEVRAEAPMPLRV
ncbi:MAG TPA: hypothetical protein VM891_01875, partial [Amaricoccus sp.]|nr:hypothetical protein [Amaricoccus sp.]